MGTKLDEVNQLCEQFKEKLRFNDSEQQSKIEELNNTIDDLNRSHLEEVSKMNENFNKELQEQIEVTKEKVEQNQQEIVEDSKYQLEEANNSGYNSSLSHQQLESEKHEQFSQLRVEMEKKMEELSL